MTEDHASLSAAEQVDRLCDQFEADWRGGRRPRLEDLLGSAAGDLRSQLLRGLLLVEWELLASAGETPSPEEYRCRFPQDTAVVEAAFAEAAAVSLGPHRAVDATATHSLRTPSIDTSRIDGEPAPQSSPSPLPKTLGRFRLLEVLGEGAFGTVLRAYDPQLEREVAIKVPREGTLQTADRQRFLREARAAAGLSHPNICRVYEVGEAEGRDYIVMELVAGEPLSTLAQQGKAQPRQAASVVRKLAMALEDAHARGIVHRDLKPANIMITPRGEPIVMDFGLARLSKPGDVRLTASGMIVGSPAYMSPEQASGATEDIGPTSDIYSLGVVLYELVCAQRPFEGTVPEVIGQILHVAPPPPSAHRPSLDPRLEAICLKAMAKKPADRFSSMSELYSALTAFLKDQPSASAAAQAVSRDDTESGSIQKCLDVAASNLKQEAAAREEETKAAIADASRGIRIPLGQWSVATAMFGAAVLLGIIFFARTPTATVLINIDVDLHDKSLDFLLDGKKISAEELAKPVELAVGDHELSVTRGKEEFRHYRFVVLGGRDPAIQITEMRPGPADRVKEEVADPDREVAEWVLESSGFISVQAGNKRLELRPGDPLPQVPFQLTGVFIGHESIGPTDSDLERLRGLQALKVLDLLDQGQLTDAAAAPVSDLHRLERLVLQNSQLTDKGLEQIRGLADLRELAIGGTGVGDTGLAHLRVLTRLEWLDVGRTRVTTVGLEHLKELTQLRQLLLYDNPIQDEGLVHLRGLAELKVLDLENTRVSDAGLEYLKNISKLERLLLKRTRVTLDGVKKLHAVLPHCRIESDHGTFEPSKIIPTAAGMARDIQ